MSRGTRAPVPASADFVECAACRRRRRVGRAVSICTWCTEAVCMKHLDGCRCFGGGEQQLTLLQGAE